MHFDAFPPSLDYAHAYIFGLQSSVNPDVIITSSLVIEVAWGIHQQSNAQTLLSLCLHAR